MTNRPKSSTRQAEEVHTQPTIQQAIDCVREYARGAFVLSQEMALSNAARKEWEVAERTANEIINSLQSLSASTQPDGVWLPIESAPKDGTHILFGRALPWSSSSNVCVGFWAGEQSSFPWRTDNGFVVDTNVYCYWMPLPSPPKESES